MFKKTDIAYLAGLIDADGCVGFVNNNPYRYPKCAIAMCDKKTIEWVHKTFGGRFRIFDPKNYSTTLGKKLQYICYFRKKEMISILPLTLPYLQGKREAVKEMLKWFEKPRQYIKKVN